MNPERQRQIERLYQAALEREPGLRRDFLSAACAGDNDLRRDVELLLADHPAPAPALLAAGSELGRYRIEDPLGAGGMGEVYRARDTRLGRTVAIKVAKRDFTERFEQEARAIAALNHPNICCLYDVGPNYLVMEYLDGKPLGGPVAVDAAVRHAMQICGALEAVHRKGIIHRDLKPSNIFVTPTGIKLLDFGLAKASSSRKREETETQVTQPGMVVGTPAYMAPEQIEGRELDARTDIFAIGCVLYELLSGKRAFQAESTPSLIASILRDAPQPLHEIAPQVSAGLGRVIGRCLEKDPDARWQNARDVGYALEDVRDTPPLHGAAPQRRRWPIAAAAGMLFAALALTAYLLRQPAREERTLRLSIAPPPGAEFFRAPNRGGMALSPDGRMLAFTAARNGQVRLWIRTLDTSVPREIPGTEGAHLPFWSADNVSLGFFATGKLKRVDADGGHLQVLCDVRSPQGGAWNRDGLILFGPDYSGLHRILANGGTPTPLTTLDTSLREQSHVGPQFLADGRRFVYTIDSPDPKAAGIYLGSLDDSKIKSRVMSLESWVFPAKAGPRAQQYLVWARAGSVVSQQWDPNSLRFAGEPAPLGSPVGVLGRTPDLAVSQNGRLVYGSPVELQLTWVDRNGKALGTAGEPGFFNAPQLSPDMRKVAFAHGASSHGLYILDQGRGISSRVASEGNDLVAWSPDGSQIAFDGIREGVTNVLLRRADGSGSERRLAPAPWTQHVVGWLGDGQSLVYYETNNGRRELWAAPLAVQGKPRLVRSSPHNEPEGQISTDGRWLAYSSDESGPLEVYIERFGIEPTGRPQQRWQVSGNGGNFPRWRRDGKELFYLASDGQLQSVAVKPGSEAVELAPPQVLFPLPAVFNSAYSYAVAPDGQRFLVSAPSSRRGQEPLTVIVNWPAVLER